MEYGRTACTIPTWLFYSAKTEFSCWMRVASVRLRQLTFHSDVHVS